MSKDEEYVRANWDRFTAGMDIYGYGITLATKPPHTLVGYENRKDAWAAAAEFTRERLKQIAEIGEEVNLLMGMIALLASEPGDMTAPIYRRTISRLTSALADLKRGMRTAAPDGARGNAND